MPRSALSVVLLLTCTACAGAGVRTTPAAADVTRASAGDRPGGGAGGLGVWASLTAPEVTALRGLDEARRGDMHALLALAVVASAEPRDAASYVSFQRRVDQFVSEMKPVMQTAANDWHRGYELNRAMHRVLFGDEHTELGRYQLDAARISQIFASGHFNCLSSALLYVVLARGLGLSVRAALVPSHVFVEMDTSDGKVIEVETTTPTGFDWIHDEAFYDAKAAEWARIHGLPVTTLEEYKHRRILQPLHDAEV